MRTRSLTVAEISLARTVFQSTLPYNHINISDAIGMGNRPFTLPMFNEGQSLAMVLIGPLAGFIRPSSYVINFGASGFANAMTTANRATFIHELTHVWQSFNQTIASAYIFNSLWHQAVSGGNAYNYSPGQIWGSYNVEQQASLVGDWFSRDGMSSTSARFPYIRNNIRTGRA